MVKSSSYLGYLVHFAVSIFKLKSILSSSLPGHCRTGLELGIHIGHVNLDLGSGYEVPAGGF